MHLPLQMAHKAITVIFVEYFNIKNIHFTIQNLKLSISRLNEFQFKK